MTSPERDHDQFWNNRKEKSQLPLLLLLLLFCLVLAWLLSRM